MFGKEIGSNTDDAKITLAGEIPTFGDTMSNGSMDYLAKNKAKAVSDVKKVKRTEIKE